jgi:septal ring-binding cell division protein DamX
MFKRISMIISSFLLSILLFSCSTSIGSRYVTETSNPNTSGEKKTKKIEYPEDFDMTKYHSQFDITENTNTNGNLKVWYNYTATPDTSTNKTILKTSQGYRVQVLSTDNLDDANKLKSELYLKTIGKNVYIVFEPPFYKVEVGDFVNLKEANNLDFKLKQIGYSDSRVVRETVNIFQ